MTATLNEVAGHAIQTLTADRVISDVVGRKGYRVTLRCACGSEHTADKTLPLSDVFHGGVLMYMAHLASVAEVE